MEREYRGHQVIQIILIQADEIVVPVVVIQVVSHRSIIKLETTPSQYNSDKPNFIDSPPKINHQCSSAKFLYKEEGPATKLRRSTGGEQTNLTGAV